MYQNAYSQNGDRDIVHHKNLCHKTDSTIDYVAQNTCSPLVQHISLVHDLKDTLQVRYSHVTLLLIENSKTIKIILLGKEEFSLLQFYSMLLIVIINKFY